MAVMRPAPMLLLLLLAGCSVEPAAGRAEAGVCFRIRDGDRSVLDRNIANLQTCAQRLEAVRMMEPGAGEVRGWFEGSFLFVSEAELSSARAEDGKRYPVFEPQQRAELQAAIRKLIERRAEAEAAGR